MRTLSVAVAGLGVVGRETLRLFKRHRPRLERRLGARLALAGVADRDAAREARALGLPASVKRLSDPLALAALDADIFVELMGGLDAPRRFALRVLGRGKALVTANKRLLSHAWPELSSAARRAGGRLAIEGSVGGGIPVLRALDLSLAGDRVEAVHGILNGTTNYVLTRIEEGLSAAAALREAQDAGFAEKDPSFDLSGADAAQKVSVAASLLAGGWVPPRRVETAGIESIDAADVAYAKTRLGRVPRLIASLVLDWSGKSPRAAASVAPTLVPLDHPLAAVRRQYNALLVRTASAGDLMFYGQGAGGGPTASAVLADVFLTARDILAGPPPPAPPPRAVGVIPAAEAVCGHYLRLEVRDRPGALARIAGALGREGVSIQTIHQDPAAGRSASVMITTHPSPRGRFERARRRILALAEVSRRHAAMRLLA